MARIRLYIDQPLVAGQPVPLDGAQAHYLSGVMRLRAGDAVTVFNGRDGAWAATLAEAGKRGGTLDV
ncbi:16S rRNA (uracil(1498)-N(3))-methyltransferase, partial [Paracoccus liaowanqingii]